MRGRDFRMERTREKRKMDKKGNGRSKQIIKISDEKQGEEKQREWRGMVKRKRRHRLM